MDVRTAIGVAAAGLVLYWTPKLARAGYRLWLARKQAEAEKTETLADDEAVEDLKNELKKDS